MEGTSAHVTCNCLSFHEYSWDFGGQIDGVRTLIVVNVRLNNRGDICFVLFPFMQVLII